MVTFTPMTLAELLSVFKEKLQHLYEEDEVKELFSISVNAVLNYSKSDVNFKKGETISRDILLKFNKILADLTNGKPIQYIFGKAHFYGLTFQVNPSVLIPRPETEELVDWIIAEIKIDESLSLGNIDGHPKSEIKNILDIGTGSGCIAISLKKNLPTANVNAVDISDEALQTAKEKAKLNEASVNFIQDDILNSKLSFDEGTFDVIVSNPPYVKEDERKAMHSNVLAHEPHVALFVTNENPFVFYDVIADYALKYLKKGGFLFFEINEYLGSQMIELLEHKKFTAIQLKKDMQGKDRMLRAQLPL